MAPRFRTLTNLLCVLCVLCGPRLLSAQNATPAQPVRREPPSTLRAPSRLDILRGDYGRYRANNDLLYYTLDVKVDPERKAISGSNAIRFKMLADDTRIQLELYANLVVEQISLGSTPLEYARACRQYARVDNTLCVDCPTALRAGRTYTIDVRYSGLPQEQGRFGGLAFRTDPAGRPPAERSHHARDRPQRPVLKVLNEGGARRDAVCRARLHARLLAFSCHRVRSVAASREAARTPRRAQEARCASRARRRVPAQGRGSASRA